MAIWQFVFFLVPQDKILREDGSSPLYLEQFKSRDVDTLFEEEISEEFIDYWGGGWLQLREYVSNMFPSLPSWSVDAEFFGIDGQVRVEFWKDEVICMVDARADVNKSIYFFSSLAEECKCVVILKEGGRVIAPSNLSLYEEFLKSKAYQFIQNPHKTLLDG
ncbi:MULTISPECIES: hypothetical protein [Pseudomonas]|uniref:hypothetical protein n=1 Tax=Pseudomonas TaxID=286 RepID=UPI0012E02F70|nr:MULTISPECIES: hypothetical protein [Pseudomonas]